jgi:hypothetical protein
LAIPSRNGIDVVKADSYTSLARSASRTSRVWAIIAGLALLIVVGAALTGRWIERKWSSRYEAVRLGDSRDRVYDLMGGGGHPHGCRPRQAGQMVRAAGDRCKFAETFEVPFMGYWTIEFDAEATVIDNEPLA